VGIWAIALEQRIKELAQTAPDFGILVELEAMLPQSNAVQTREAIRARVGAFRHFEGQLPAIEQAERAYLADATTSDDLVITARRPAVVDVAQLVTYRRIRNHADPFDVLNANLSVVGVKGALPVARAAEVALIRRYDELHYDQLQGPDGDVFRRPAGYNIHPRYRVLAQRAAETHRAPEFLEEILPAFRDSERDPEYLRIDHYVSRLVEGNLIRLAIATIRPLTRGVLIDLPKWPRQVMPLSRLMFEEYEGPQPLVNMQGDVVDWQELVRRHPESNVASTALASPTIPPAEPTWMVAYEEEAEAYAPPGPTP
jgi:hypothetical protein